MSDVETDIAEFMDEVDGLTAHITPTLLVDWRRLVSKLRTNLAAVSYLMDRGDGYAIEFLDDVRHIIRDRRSGLHVRLFEVLGAFDDFQREHLILISPSVAMTRTDAPVGRA